MTRATEMLRAARDYYDQATTLYLSHLGSTFQAGVARSPGREADAIAYQRHNLFLAERAGVTGDERVLDAGCGVCGPAADVAAHFDRLSVVGVTVSGVQARAARRLVRKRGLEARVHVALADFHRLPFAAGAFDLATFYESAGYSHDQGELFGEVARVLAPGGRLYVKDVFRCGGELSAERARQLETFDTTFVYRTRSLDQCAIAIRAAGFRDLRIADLSEELDTHRFQKAMFERTGPQARLNAFGERHFKAFDRLPVFFGDILAVR
jgi:sterol 24-C-methyltransferase